MYAWEWGESNIQIGICSSSSPPSSLYTHTRDRKAKGWTIKKKEKEKRSKFCSSNPIFTIDRGKEGRKKRDNKTNKTTRRRTDPCCVCELHAKGQIKSTWGICFVCFHVICVVVVAAAPKGLCNGRPLVNFPLFLGGIPGLD